MLSWPAIRRSRDWRNLQRARNTALEQAGCLDGVLESALGKAWQQALATPLPAPEQSVQQLDYLAIDLETSGLHPRQDEIISIAWVPLSARAASATTPARLCIELAGAQHCVLQARQKVGQSAVIHGIRDCDRHQGQNLEHVLTALFQALAGRWPVFHHGRLDLGFLQQALWAWSLTWPSLYWDTLIWQQQRRQRRQEEIRHGELQLGQARRYYHLPARQAHNALDDALSCAELFLALSGQSRAQVAHTYCYWPGQ